MRYERYKQILALNQDIIKYTKIFVYGQRFPLTVGAPKNAIKDGEVCVKTLKSLKKLYLDGFLNNFLERFKAISTGINLTPTSLSFKNYKSRWGCCSGANAIILNYKIFMLPRALQDYIVIHELCHIVHHNHSAAFWALVKSILPEYKTLSKQLKDFDFLTRLY